MSYEEQVRRNAELERLDAAIAGVDSILLGNLAENSPEWNQAINQKADLVKRREALDPQSHRSFCA